VSSVARARDTAASHSDQSVDSHARCDEGGATASESGDRVAMDAIQYFFLNQSRKFESARARASGGHSAPRSFAIQHARVAHLQ